jgi:hypothetical protein
MSRFETETSPEIIRLTAVPYLTAIKEVAPVKLKARLVGYYFKHPAGKWFKN